MIDSLACLCIAVAVPAWASDGDEAPPPSTAVAEIEGPSLPAEVEPPAAPPTASQAVPGPAESGPTESIVDPSAPPGFEKPEIVSEDQDPWDYSPYRVLIWLVSQDPSVNVDSIEQPLRAYLDRDFAALWRMHIAEAPTSVRAAAIRDIEGMSYDLITSADPVLAVKRDHKEAVRIRTANNVAEFVQKIYSTAARIEEVKRRAADLGDASIEGVAARLEAIPGDAVALRQRWVDPSTEALLVARGMALTLTEPEAKLITPKLSGLVAKAVENFDKIFIVCVRSEQLPLRIDIVELDALMHHFGPVASVESASAAMLPVAIGNGVIKAFAPVVRIENAGQKNAVGLLRAGGLIVEEDSPAAIRVNDVLEPMTRKNDRNDNPILIGPIDWAFLLVRGLEGRNINMDYYSGRAGTLQGRKNQRTFRTALKVRPFGESSLLRLHLQREPDFPLIGYELYDKELESTKMTFIGRTDWNGRLAVEKTETPLRLLYVKNGGAVLARLPIVPGLHAVDVADLSGDDLRLQAEAYIRGIQNAIIDLVAVRELFKARIVMRLERGEMDQAEELLKALREQPTNENLAADLGKKQSVFLQALGTRNPSQRRKVDEMFAVTQEMLGKHINPKLLRDLETDFVRARNNGGKLPPRQPTDDAGQPPQPSDTPAAAQPQAGENAGPAGQAAAGDST